MSMLGKPVEDFKGWGGMVMISCCVSHRPREWGEDVDSGLDEGSGVVESSGRSDCVLSVWYQEQWFPNTGLHVHDVVFIGPQ